MNTDLIARITHRSFWEVLILVGDGCDTLHELAEKLGKHRIYTNKQLSILRHAGFIKTYRNRSIKTEPVKYSLTDDCKEFMAQIESIKLPTVEVKDEKGK